MSPQTERYLDLARQGKNDWWRYALGAAFALGAWFALGPLPFRLFARAGLVAPLHDFIAVNFSIFILFGGVAAAVKLLHGRTLLSLATPARRLDWRRVGQGALVWTGFAAALAVLEHLLFPGRYQITFDGARFLLFLGPVLVLTPLQCAAEELVFRGYVMQGLGLLTRRPALIAALSSLVFTLPHLLNPEAATYGAFIMGLNYFAVGMLLATVALRDGRLELAIGVHAANNMFLALVVNYEGSALATAPAFTARELDPVYSLVTLVCATLVFHRWIFRRPPQTKN